MERWRVAQPADNSFGDGVLLVGPGAAGMLHSNHLADAGRAGIANFGSYTEIEGSVLECHPIYLDGERYLETDYDFEDKGGNICGCAGAHDACQVMSSNVTPPLPLETR